MQRLQVVAGVMFVGAWIFGLILAAGWLANGGLIFAPLLAISGLAFPLNSHALYASLELTLLLLLSWVVAVTVVIARRTPRTEAATTRAAAPVASQ